MLKSLIATLALTVLSVPAVAQLMPGDAVILTSSGITHVRGGASAPVVPVPIDGNALPGFWGDGAMEWVPNTSAVLAGCDVAPFGLYYIDFASSLTAPTSKLIGLGVGGIRDIDVIPQTGDMLVLQSIPQASGRVDILTAPVGPSSVLGAAPPWCAVTPIGNTDYMAVQSTTSVVMGGVANIYRVNQNNTPPYTLMAMGTSFYSAESADIDPLTGDLFIALFNPDYVRRYTMSTSTMYVDTGPIMAFPDVDGPDDVEFDPATGTIYAIARNGGQVSGSPVGVQAGNDNVIIGSPIGLPPGVGILTLTPNPTGNAGFFPNFTIVGTMSLAQVQIAGVGCNGSNSQLVVLTNNGMPSIGSNTFGLTLSGAPANSFGYLFLALGLSPAPVPLTPTCNLYLDITTMSLLMSTGLSPIGPLPLGPAGSIFVPTPIPNQAGLLGAIISVQGAVIDGGVAGGFTTSNALALILGY